MTNSDIRATLIQIIADPASSPMKILASAVSYVRMTSPFGPRIAAAVDAAIKKEVEAMQAEADVNRLRPR